MNTLLTIGILGVTSPELEEFAYSLNTVWVLIAAVLVFMMQAGFALVEAGFTRSKNTTNILFKNLMDFTL
jgi:Amt family ammonium transporter